jgi:hypothetical protein
MRSSPWPFFDRAAWTRPKTKNISINTPAPQTTHRTIRSIPSDPGMASGEVSMAKAPFIDNTETPAATARVVPARSALVVLEVLAVWWVVSMVSSVFMIVSLSRV